MGQITFTANLKRHVSCPAAPVRGGTVQEALAGVFDDNPGLRPYLLDEHGRLRRHINIFVNDERISDRARLSDPIGPDDDIFVFQALSGG